MIDVGSFGATQIRNGTQYFARIDQGFKKERIYVQPVPDPSADRRRLAHAAILGPEQHLAM